MMTKVLSFLVPVVLAGATYLSLSSDTANERTAGIAPSSTVLSNATEQQSKVQEIRDQAKIVADDPKSMPETKENRFDDLKGALLYSALERFWEKCRAIGDCTSQLDKALLNMDERWYQLLFRFPSLSDEWSLQQANIPLENAGNLKERVQLFKEVANQVWGDMASVILSDQFTLLDFRLASEEITHVEPEMFFEAYQSLISQWNTSVQGLNVSTNAEQYEYGLSLIPSHYSHENQRGIRKMLRLHHLESEDIRELEARENQVNAQKIEVNDYQLELRKVKSRLADQRTREKSHLNDREWESYYHQQVTEFRQEFFSVK